MFESHRITKEKGREKAYWVIEAVITSHCSALSQIDQNVSDREVLC